MNPFCSFIIIWLYLSKFVTVICGLKLLVIEFFVFRRDYGGVCTGTETEI